jgi:hypothetical protein
MKNTLVLFVLMNHPSPLANLGGLPKVRRRRDISAGRADKEYQETDHLFSRSSPLAILKPGLPKVTWEGGTRKVVTHKNYQEVGFFLPSIYPEPLYLWQSSNQVCQR